MADLVSIAQRLNDVEINNNAPVSSQTLRRSGSSVNYLLDLVGATNGDTNPTGPLGTILQPVAAISYSRSFTNADVGASVNLFTFEGGGDRPLQFFQRSSGFRNAEHFSSSITSSAQSASLFQSPNHLPILYLLTRFVTKTALVSIGAPIFIVRCNGIEMGRTIRASSSESSIVYTRDIHHAPLGTNTVTVHLQFAMNSPPILVQNSFEYVAI